MSKPDGERTITVRVTEHTVPQSRQPGSGIDPGDVSQQAGGRSSRAFRDLPLSAEKVGDEFRTIIDTLEESVLSPGSASSGFSVAEVKVGLTFNGSGKLVLIGELGVKASIEVTLRST